MRARRQPSVIMFIEARSWPAGKLLTADVAIVGTGPAGITLARRLASYGRQVILFEAGELESNEQISERLIGKNIGEPYELAVMRRCLFGGTSRAWAGICVPLSPEDIESWPISEQELAPYYQEAAQILALEPKNFISEGGGPVQIGAAQLDLNKFRQTMIYISTLRDFGQIYFRELKKSQLISTVIQAPITHIQLAPSGSKVDYLTVRRPGQEDLKVQARQYVIAAGGIENTRLLLVSRDIARQGIGNGQDLVGRFFMEHPHLHAGFVQSRVPLAAWQAYTQAIHQAATTARRFLTFTPVQRRDGHLPSISFECNVRLIPKPLALKSWERAAVALLHQEYSRGREQLEEATAAFEWSALRSWWPRRHSLVVAVALRSEQLPNPESRVMLANECDNLGMPRVALRWQFTPDDYRGVSQAIAMLAEELERQSLGKFHWLLPREGRWLPSTIAGAGHHMGTTRMSADPKKGVVNEQCRVHEVDNLYVAGSSVFPTSGWANPVLTTIALTLRLARHLYERP